MGLFNPWRVGPRGRIALILTHVNLFKMAHSEKSLSSDVATPIQENIGLSVNTRSTSLDKAAVYLHDHGQFSEEGSVNAKMLLRKIDWRFLPLAFACTTMQFIDKFTINVCVPAPIFHNTN